MSSDQPSPASDDRVLVAFLPEPRDLHLAETQGWYRIRQRTLAERLRGGLSSFRFLAFYQPESFGPEKYSVRRFARIRSIREAPRVELLPDETGHPRAHHVYCKLELGPVQLLDRPVISLRPRRILFFPTTWERLQKAEEINELFVGTTLEDVLYRQLRMMELRPEREYYLDWPNPARRGQPKHPMFLDFAVFCRDRNLNIEADGDAWHTGPTAAASDNERDNLLEANGWHVLRFNRAQIQQEMPGVAAVIRTAVNRYGGHRDPAHLIRFFAADGRLGPAQGTLDL